MQYSRRDFLKVSGLGMVAGAVNFTGTASAAPHIDFESADWPVLKRYDQDHLLSVALPLGGIGTGTVSLGGRGDLRDWEIMNRPAKGFVPLRNRWGPFFAVRVETVDGAVYARALEGPIEESQFEGSHGSTVPNHGLPRFARASFATAYPLGQVMLSDPELPLKVRLEAFNPLVPGDPDISGLPVVVLRYVLENSSRQPLTVSVCGSMPNFIGMDGSEFTEDWKGDLVPTGAKGNRNSFRKGEHIRGISMESEGVDPVVEQWGTIALTTTEKNGISWRTNWSRAGWGTSLLDFWDDFTDDAAVRERPDTGEDMPMGSVNVSKSIAPGDTATVTFLLTWHFPNRMTWTPKGTPEDRIGNYYTTQFEDAWDAGEQVAAELPALEARTVEFVRAFCASDLPEIVKEAALFNVSTLRTQTCFRTPDGRFFGFEGSSSKHGCCHGSCTHVWNYEQATAFLFGSLARTMREVEFKFATDDEGLMSFRVGLPLSRANEQKAAAADGQMGCIMKIYRDWQLSGDDAMLRSLWPRVKKALAFAWIEGGWDANQDGVMEGCQHNTMDVEYYGPNPQMGIWYLGALRAAGAMGRYLKDIQFARKCERLFEQGSQWLDAHLFNGEYYEHQVVAPESAEDVAPSLRIGMGAEDVINPDYQLGGGCLVDQLVGQYMAHVCGLGYLVRPAHARKTLESIRAYNTQQKAYDQFNCMRSFVMGDETSLLMASYPRSRPENPFPYFTETMTGFEYTAAVGMLYEGMKSEGLEVVHNIRARYDGYKRSPFDEAECGHHYARAMASWAAVLALTGFRYSGVEQRIEFARSDDPVEWFWSNGDAWGTVEQMPSGDSAELELQVIHGDIAVKKVGIQGLGTLELDQPVTIHSGQTERFLEEAEG